MTCPKSAIPTSTGTKINMISADSMNACPRCFLRDLMISLLRIRRSVLAYIRHSDARLAIKIERRDHGVHCVISTEEHASELQSHSDLVCRLLLEKKKNT